MVVFIAGPRKVSRFNKKIEEKLDNIYENQFDVIVGDANGVDKAVQKFFYNKKYQKVTVYSIGSVPRNNVGKWKVCSIETKRKTKDFSYYVEKDIQMAEKADLGLMLWNGTSKGTLHNMLNMLIQDKQLAVYFFPDSKFHIINHINDLERLLEKCDDETMIMYKGLLEMIKRKRANQIAFSLE